MDKRIIIPLIVVTVLFWGVAAYISLGNIIPSKTEDLFKVKVTAIVDYTPLIGWKITNIRTDVQSEGIGGLLAGKRFGFFEIEDIKVTINLGKNEQTEFISVSRLGGTKEVTATFRNVARGLYPLTVTVSEQNRINVQKDVMVSIGTE